MACRRNLVIVAYLLRRLSYRLLVLGGVVVLVFVLTNLLVKPANLILPTASGKIKHEHVRLGLDAPVPVRFLRFLAGAARLDFGVSLWQDKPAMQLVRERLGATVLLALTASGLAFLLGIPCGALAARHPGSSYDRICSLLSWIGMSIADFWLGFMLIFFFAITWYWFPTSGYGPYSLVLPSLTLALRPAGRLALLTRAAMLDEMRQLYTTAARAKGLHERRVLCYALRNAAGTLLTLGGYEIGRMFAGHAVVVETIFGWPGLGQLAVQAMNNDDLPVMQAVVFVAAAIVALFYSVVELGVALLDPRIRHSWASAAPASIRKDKHGTDCRSQHPH